MGSIYFMVFFFNGFEASVGVFEEVYIEPLAGACGCFFTEYERFFGGYVVV